MTELGVCFRKEWEWEWESVSLLHHFLIKINNKQSKSGLQKKNRKQENKHCSSLNLSRSIILFVRLIVDVGHLDQMTVTQTASDLNQLQKTSILRYRYPQSEASDRSASLRNRSVADSSVWTAAVVFIVRLMDNSIQLS